MCFYSCSCPSSCSACYGFGPFVGPVLLLLVVDNSNFSPSRLTCPPTLRILPSQKETVPAPHFKPRGFFMNQQMFLFFLLFFLALLCTLCWPHPGPAQSRAAAKMRTMLHRH